MRTALRTDVQYALRQIRRYPGLAVLAVLSLALGIGANTALFELANRALFKPLDVPRADRLASVTDGDAASGRWRENSFREYMAYRERATAFSGVAASSQTNAALAAGDLTRLIVVSPVSRNFFDVLGVVPALGSFFGGPDIASGSEDAQVVLGDGLWRGGFAADRSIVGRTIRLNGRAFVVIGIAPRGFNGLELGSVDAYVPLHAVPILAPTPASDPNDVSLTNDKLRWLRVTGRLAPGATIQQAAASIDAVRSAIPYAPDQLPPGGRMVTSTVPTVSTIALLGSDGGIFVLLLGGVMIFTLLIACANLATLRLATGAARAREFAIRTALGAGRGRLVRQLVTESTVLALLGGGVSLLVASWTADLLRSFPSAAGLSFSTMVRDPGLGTVAVALLLALACSILIGLLPAIAVTTRGPATSLMTRHGGETLGRSRLRSWLMGTQIALALVLLTGAGLFGRSLRNAMSLDVGFRTDRLAVVAFNLGLAGYDSARAQTFLTTLVERAGAAPGIERVALAERVPVRAAGARSSAWIERAGVPTNLGEESFNLVGPGYFETVGIAIQRGRAFAASDDAGGANVVIVNEALAARAWPGEDALGKRFWFGDPTNSPSMVVGVARNSKYRSLRETGLPYFYLPIGQHFHQARLSTLRIVFRSATPTEQSIAQMRQIIRSLDPELPLIQAESVIAQLGSLLGAQRLGTTILGLLSLIGLGLALSGLFSVVSYAVARRTHEIGVRIALGAQARDVVRLTLGQGIRSVLLGALAGSVIVLLLGRVATSFLFGVAPRDPLTIGVAVVVLLAVSVAAMLMPSLRATRIAPTQALREE